MPREFIKDPNAVLDYTINWSAWLATSETIATATWTVPTGITQDSVSKTTTTTTIWLSSGTANTNYDITCRVTTNQGRTTDRTIQIQVRSR